MRSCLLCHASVILCLTPATACIWCGCRSLYGWWHSCHVDNDDAGKGAPTVTLHTLTLGLFDHHVTRGFWMDATASALLLLDIGRRTTTITSSSPVPQLTSSWVHSRRTPPKPTLLQCVAKQTEYRPQWVSVALCIDDAGAPAVQCYCLGHCLPCMHDSGPGCLLCALCDHTGSWDGHRAHLLIRRN